MRPYDLCNPQSNWPRRVLFFSVPGPWTAVLPGGFPVVAVVSGWGKGALLSVQVDLPGGLGASFDSVCQSGRWRIPGHVDQRHRFAGRRPGWLWEVGRWMWEIPVDGPLVRIRDI